MTVTHPSSTGFRPRVHLLADRPGWAFDQVAHALRRRLSHRFDVRVIHQHVDTPHLDPEDVDLLYVFWWGDQSYRHLALPPERVVKEVASHRWALEAQFGRLDVAGFAARYLDDCATVTTPSLELFDLLEDVHPHVFHCPNGVELSRFRCPPRRGQALRIAWAGNPDDACKGLHDILRPACAGRFDLDATDGARSHAQVAHLYARSDVIAVASEAESQPLPLLEAMASGCFPVTTDVGIARELIEHGVNGLVVERTPEAFRRAFAWCQENLDIVRRAGRTNARLVAEERHWDLLAPRFGALFDHLIAGAEAPSPRSERSAAGPAREALVRGRIPARVAFVTPELAGATTRCGGLGTYVRRMGQALSDAGHEVEVFTLETEHAAADRDDPILLHRVPEAISRTWVRGLLGGARMVGLGRVAAPLLAAVEAVSLVRALRRRERTRPFDLVQSSDYRATGLFVAGRSRTGRPHLVRVSNDEAELAARNGEDAAWRSGLDALQRHCMRRADAAYAPSAFLARHYVEHHGIALYVVRPPSAAETAPGELPDLELPKRYLVHFGQLTPVKGSGDLALALPRVWERAPDFEMVWVGVDREQRLAEWRRHWGARGRQVHWLGSLPRGELRAVVAGAEAAVLPSRFDNLPNTAIESLELGVPVIGTDGASLEELVEPGRDGVLVPVGDPEALADALVQAWCEGPLPRRSGPVRGLLEPARAVAALFARAGLREGPRSVSVD